MPLMECPVTTFSNTESRIKPSAGEENTFRGKHMFVIQTGSFSAGCSINDHVMETRLLMDACRRGGCKSITLVMPFYPYARQDKKDSSRF
jgi:ribose-phosphate pyrophosphokinase